MERLADHLEEGIDLSTWQPHRGWPSLDANAREQSPRKAERGGRGPVPAGRPPLRGGGPPDRRADARAIAVTRRNARWL